jgi:Late competence development protein ComFB
MPANFESLRNYYERQVFEQVLLQSSRFPLMEEDHLPDVACVALNRLPPRYIRHEVDLAFYLTEKERQDNERLVIDSVSYAFEFVQARFAMRARR